MAGAVGAAVAAQRVANNKSSNTKSDGFKMTSFLKSAGGGEAWSGVFDEDETLPEGKWRRKVAICVNTKIFETFLGLVIFLNMVLVLMEADATVDNKEAPEWMVSANYVLLTVYIIELIMKIFAFGYKFFHTSWNIIDFMVVTVDVILIALGFIVGDVPSVSVLRVFRLARLARAFKMLNMFPELKLLMQGLLGAARAIFWGLVMIFLLMIIWGILAVQIIHPINKEVTHTEDRTARAFSSVWQSILTFWQTIVAGDSWGQVALPIIQLQPWTLIFFGAVLVTVGLAMMNLILAVIVESATEARQLDQHKRAVEQEKLMMEAKSRLLEVCEEMDGDGTGTLSIDEFKGGFDENGEFADLLKVMNITKDDLQMVFKVCDQDNSGDVEFVEFVENIHRMKCKESQLILFYVTEIRTAVNHMFKAFEVANGHKHSKKRVNHRKGSSASAASAKSEYNEVELQNAMSALGMSTQTKLRDADDLSASLSANVEKLMAISSNLAEKVERSCETMDKNSQALNSFTAHLSTLRLPGPMIPSMASDAQFSPVQRNSPGQAPNAHVDGSKHPRSPPPDTSSGHSMCCASRAPTSERMIVPR